MYTYIHIYRYRYIEREIHIHVLCRCEWHVCITMIRYIRVSTLLLIMAMMV